MKFSLNTLATRRGGTLITCVAMLVCCAAVGSAQGFNGAVYTTLGNGQTVNQNLFPSKADVYLNGGPQNVNAQGLPPGNYYFQVTNPNGAVLLSTDPAANRICKVLPNGRVGGSTLTGTHANGASNPNNGQTGVQLVPFDDTPNGGGEYKVWLIPMGGDTSVDIDGIHLHFKKSKTDNFKVAPAVPPQEVTYSLSGTKFYDTNMSGFNEGEPGIVGVKIHVKYCLPNTTTWINLDILTGPFGYWSLPSLPDGTKYHVTEVINGAWYQTAPAYQTNFNDRSYDGIIQGGDVTGLDFGNIATSSICGIKFYDKNMNGAKDGTEVNVPGFTINYTVTYQDSTVVTGSGLTDANGKFKVGPFPAGSSFSLNETIPPRWMQTAAPSAGTTNTAYTTDGNGDVSVNFVLGATTGQNFGNIAFGPISGYKFYDSDGSGTWNTGDAPIQGFMISIQATWPNGFVDNRVAVTDVNGFYKELGFPDGTTYTITELMPTGNWVQTFPASGSYTGTTSGTGTIDVNFQTTDVVDQTFGNYVLGQLGGHTLGFWSNKNGLKTMQTDPNTIAELVGLNLRNAAGNNFDPGGYPGFQNWLLNANANNMANMLSAQMAAMYLNVKFGITPGGAYIYAPGAAGANVNGFITVNALLAEANTELGLHGLTLTGSPYRAYQEALKTALDNGNNNLNVYILPPVPPVVY